MPRIRLPGRRNSRRNGLSEKILLNLQFLSFPFAKDFFYDEMRKCDKVRHPDNAASNIMERLARILKEKYPS